MQDGFFDKLAMLLSTDWFYPWWNAIGIRIDEQKKDNVRILCQKEVENFTRGFNIYWEASFDDERMSSTRAKMLAYLSEYVDQYSAIFPYISNDIITPEVTVGEIPADLIGTLTDIFIDTHSTEQIFSDKLKEVVIESWRNSGDLCKDYSQLCEDSDGYWDRIISKLTPDLPCMTADFVTIEICVYDQVGMYWSKVRSSLDADDIAMLISWYEGTAQNLLNDRLIIPAWMR